MNRNKKETSGKSMNVRIFCLVLAGVMIFGVVAGALALVL